jgi:hypothetical protein
MHIIHLHSGSDGRSHLADQELRLTSREDGAGVDFSAAAQGVAFRAVPPNVPPDFHTAPRRQLVIQLTGTHELICGDGTSRIVGPGDAVLADDRTGEGHVSREISGPRTQAVIYLDPDFDLQTLFTD